MRLKAPPCILTAVLNHDAYLALLLSLYLQTVVIVLHVIKNAKDATVTAMIVIEETIEGETTDARPGKEITGIVMMVETDAVMKTKIVEAASVADEEVVVVETLSGTREMTVDAGTIKNDQHLRSVDHLPLLELLRFLSVGAKPLVGMSLHQVMSNTPPCRQSRPVRSSYIVLGSYLYIYRSLQPPWG